MPNITTNHAITCTSSLPLRVDFHCRVIFTCANKSKPPFCTNPNINPSEKATLAQVIVIVNMFS